MRIPAIAIALARALLSALLVFALPAPASATPPTVITVDDQPFGVNDKELFLLRTTTDNLGSHFHQQTESFLVAVDLWDGTETLWHVDSAQIATVFAEDGGADRREVTRGGRAGLADPFAILAERGALPWAALSMSRRGLPAATIHQRGDEVIAALANGQTYSLGKNAAIKRMRVGLAGLAQQVPNYPRMESITTREQFALSDFAHETCQFTNGGQGFSPWFNEAMQLIRISCTDVEQIGEVSFVMVATQNAVDVP